MTIAGKTILITGANRGIGRAILTEALNRDAKRVYAASRQATASLDKRVTHLILDVSHPSQVKAAADEVETLDILINNAGFYQPDDLSDRRVIEQHLAVNTFGPLYAMQAFTPALTRTRGAIVNVLSLAGLGALAWTPSYSISKAAAFSMSQSMRVLLAARGVSVHIVLPGPVDTDMTRGLELPKASPESVAQAIFDGVENGDEEIFPDPLSSTFKDGWNNGVLKEFERQNAMLVAEAVTA